MDFKNLHSRFLRSLGFNNRTKSIVFTSALYSSVEMASHQGSSPLFLLKICGSILPPRALPRTIVKITVSDVTEGEENPLAVLGSSNQWQLDESGKFCFISELGPLPNTITTFNTLTTIAQIHPNWLVFPRSGKRTLQFSLSILSFDEPIKVASSDCTFTYENSSPGYLDLNDNNERAKILTVTIAFSVIGNNGKFSKNEIGLIKQWAKQNIGGSDTSSKNQKQLERALNRTISLLRGGSTINTEKVCRELVKIAGRPVLIDAMEFCLLAARAGGMISRGKLKHLKQLAEQLMIDKKTFIVMVQKFLSLETCEDKDEEIFLGVRCGMSSEETRLLLNEQYRKWSSRVTNFDPQIRNQAANMLRLIAETRNLFIK
jgi:hypothetical protein